jgi:hypothetical protein
MNENIDIAILYDDLNKHHINLIKFHIKKEFKETEVIEKKLKDQPNLENIANQYRNSLVLICCNEKLVAKWKIYDMPFENKNILFLDIDFDKENDIYFPKNFIISNKNIGINSSKALVTDQKAKRQKIEFEWLNLINKIKQFLNKNGIIETKM